jgi:hypothetical protein
LPTSDACLLVCCGCHYCGVACVSPPCDFAPPAFSHGLPLSFALSSFAYFVGIVRSIEKHMERILEKLGVENRDTAVV